MLINLLVSLRALAQAWDTWREDRRLLRLLRRLRLQNVFLVVISTKKSSQVHVIVVRGFRGFSHRQAEQKAWKKFCQQHHASRKDWMITSAQIMKGV